MPSRLHNHTFWFNLIGFPNNGNTGATVLLFGGMFLGDPINKMGAGVVGEFRAIPHLPQQLKWTIPRYRLRKAGYVVYFMRRSPKKHTTYLLIEMNHACGYFYLVKHETGEKDFIRIIQTFSYEIRTSLGLIAQHFPNLSMGKVKVTNQDCRPGAAVCSRQVRSAAPRRSRLRRPAGSPGPRW